MRPCPNCECFVPEAAKRCPRCEGALEPIAREAAPERELVLVGAGSPAGAESPSSTPSDPITRSVLARIALPPVDGPAGLPRRPTLPKLPQPFAPDPLVLAVFLGIPVADPTAVAEEPAPPFATPTEIEPAAELSPATIAAIADAAAVIAASVPPPLPTPVPTSPTEAPTPPFAQLPNDAFALLLGTTAAEAPAPPAVPVAAPAPAPAPSPTPSPAAPELIATPLATPVAAPAITPLPAPPTRPRLWRRRNDPFATKPTRRERLLAKACITLGAALVVSVGIMRLPIGPRPQLGASTGAKTGADSTAIGTASAPVTTPFADAIRVQTRADLAVVVKTANNVDRVFKSYSAASPSVLAHALPQFAFVSGTDRSTQVGELSVAGSKHEIVFAEYAGPHGCAYGRVIDRQTVQTSIGTADAPCRASTPPATGWTRFNPNG